MAQIPHQSAMILTIQAMPESTPTFSGEAQLPARGTATRPFLRLNSSPILTRHIKDLEPRGDVIE